MKPICKISTGGARCEIGASGTKRYYVNNLLHREGGPAIEYPDGSNFWYLNGLQHREDGPAIEYCDGSKYWYYHGKWINCKDNEEFLRIIKLMVFI